MAGDNPYVGPRSFREDESGRFFGREEEIRRLRALAVARRAVLLYSPSGAGKTSLLQAGLLPHLRREVPGACPLPIVRLGGAAEAGSANPYIFHLLLDLLGDTSLSLQEGLARAVERAQQERRDEEAEAFFLVIDQGEEIFTLDPHRHDERRDFFVQLHEALEAHRRVTLILALREEYLAHLDPFLSYLPDRLRTRFRLDLLGPEAARQAIVEPAQQAGVQFTASAARRLVDDLGRGQPVDPVQLQVVCHRLWSRRPADAVTIDDALVAGFADVDHALADYYAERVRSVARETGVDERAIRLWFEHELITPQGVRGQVLAGETQKLAPPTVAALVDSHLVRAEARRNAVWYELAHDRLIQPVRDSNREWLARNERPIDRLAQQATLWQKEKKARRLLLKGSALKQAEQAVAASGEEAPREVQELLAASLRRRSFRRWLTGLAAFLLLAGLTVLVALGELTYTAMSFGAQKLVTIETEILRTRDEQIDHALLLALGAVRIRTLFTRMIGPDPRRLLYLALEASPHLDRLLPIPSPPFSLALSPDGRTLATGSLAGTLQLWDTATGRRLSPPLPAHKAGVWSLAFSPDGRALVSTGGDGVLRLWDPATPNATPRQAGVDLPAVDIHFHPDGRSIALVLANGSIRLWDLTAGGRPAAPPLAGAAVRWLTAAFSADGRALAAGGNDGTVQLWDAAGGLPLGPPQTGHTAAVTGLAFRPDGRSLVSAGADGVLVFRDPRSGAPQQSLDSRLGPVAGLSFSGDSRALALAGLQGLVAVWDAEARFPLGEPFRGRIAPTRRLALSSGGETIATTSGPVAALWKRDAGVPFGTVVPLSPAGFRRAAFRRDAKAFAALGAELELWSLQGAAPQKAQLPAAQGVAALALDPAGRSLATGDAAGQVDLWDLTGPPRAHAVARHGGAVTALAFSGDGENLASGGADGAILVWQRRAQSLRSRPAGGGAVRALAWSPAGALLAAGGEDGRIVFWHPLSSAPPRPLWRACPGPVSSLAFRPDGRLFAAGCANGSLRFLAFSDDDDEEPRETAVPGVEIPITRLAFSPDGKTLAVGRGEGTLLLYSVDKTEQILIAGPLRGHRGGLAALAFASPDTLLSVGLDGRLTRWDVNPQSWISQACRIAYRELTADEKAHFFDPYEPESPLCERAGR
jgi:WD40 repeat protein